MVYKSNSICWECSNAVPANGYGCSWSRKFEPVKGWIAERHLIKKKGCRELESYCVKMCPQYEHMSKRKKVVEIDDEGAQTFAVEVLRHALRNYATGMYDTLENGGDPTTPFINAACFLSSEEAENYAECAGYEIDWLVRATKYRTKRLWHMPPLSNEAIVEFLKRRGKTKTEFSLELGKSPGYINNLLKYGRKGKIDERKLRKKIALGLQLTEDEVHEAKKPENRWMIWRETNEFSNINREIDKRPGSQVHE